MAKSKQAASSAKPARSARTRAAAGPKAGPAKAARKLTRSGKREPQKSTGETKQARVIAILARDNGATLAELIAVTGWLPHTTRAALTGLRHKGFVLDKSKREDGTTVYRITRTPASAARQAG